VHLIGFYCTKCTHFFILLVPNKVYLLLFTKRVVRLF